MNTNKPFLITKDLDVANALLAKGFKLVSHNGEFITFANTMPLTFAENENSVELTSRLFYTDKLTF